MQPMNEPNDEEREEKLPADFDTPFSPPDDIRQTLPKDHQAFDINIDSDQAYNDGEDAAGDQLDETVDRSLIKMRDQGDSKHNGLVRIIKPAREQKKTDS